MQFAGIHGPQTHTRYLASIGLWAAHYDRSNIDDQSITHSSTLFGLENPIEIVDMDPNANFDLIIGWDVLKGFSFNFDTNSNIFELIIQN